MRKEWFLKRDTAKIASCTKCELVEWCATSKTSIDLKKLTGTACDFSSFYIFLPTTILKRKRF